MSYRWVALWVAMIVGGCAASEGTPASSEQSRASGGGSDYESVTLTLPIGDPEPGRQAFVDLRCVACHRVEGDETLPDPVSRSEGPMLGRSLAERPVGSLATAIVAPSHAMSLETSAETRATVEGVLSPMGDYSESMTVRQLLDLLAYVASR